MIPRFRCLFLTLVLSSATFAIDIDGVQPAAIDQPRVSIIVRRDAKANPLVGESALAGKTSRIAAFLDTGASGIMLSTHTANLLGIKHQTLEGKDATFEDIGVGGSDRFAISEPLFLAVAPYNLPDADADDPAKSDAFKSNVGPARFQLGPMNAIGGGLMELLGEDVDVVGMPALKGKVLVMNTGIVNSFMDTIGAYVYEPNTTDHPDLRKTDPGIPKTKYHVKLSAASFTAFTKTTPAGAQPPLMEANPFIGPSPLPGDGKPDPTPPVIVTGNGKSSSGSWLLDTGAAASMISQSQAKAIGVQYIKGTEGTDHPKLEGVPAADQFTMTIGGVGGAKKSAGFYLETLTLKTQEGQPIVFKHAPVLVSDITIEDPQTKKQLTLDGVFGMNFLVATAKIDENSALPDIDKLTAGGFKWVVFDQPKGMLGLEPTDDVARSAK